MVPKARQHQLSCFLFHPFIGHREHENKNNLQGALHQPQSTDQPVQSFVKENNPDDVVVMSAGSSQFGFEMTPESQASDWAWVHRFVREDLCYIPVWKMCVCARQEQKNCIMGIVGSSGFGLKVRISQPLPHRFWLFFVERVFCKSPNSVVAQY